MNLQNVTLVPWKDWDEWIFVKDSIFSDEQEKKKIGIEYINMWRSRCYLPHLVEMTAQIVDFELRTNKYSQLNENGLRYEGAAIIIRFVNGVLDGLQPSFRAKSITYLADKVSLPRMFVDIRHEATHNQLPSIQLLNFVFPHAIYWLKEYYWNEQYEVISKPNIVYDISTAPVEFIFDFIDEVPDTLDALVMYCKQNRALPSALMHYAIRQNPPQLSMIELLLSNDFVKEFSKLKSKREIYNFLQYPMELLLSLLLYFPTKESKIVYIEIIKEQGILYFHQ